MTPSQSTHTRIRGLDYHVRTWGNPHARKLFLLHGWMDVSASFQFLVDALAHEWHVLAPDWRGFGLSEIPADGYWFADYVADLDALARAFAPDEPIDVVGHSLGANVAMIYAGVRPSRVARVVALDGFGVRGDPPTHAPRKYAAWLDALVTPPSFALYRNMAAVADRLQKNNPRLPRDKAEFLAPHWAEALPDGTARLRADFRHKLPFPTPSRTDETFAIWQRITARVLWVAAAQSPIGGWLASAADDHVRGDAGDADAVARAQAEIARRFAQLPNGEMVTVEDAGHMLHHDQPEIVARHLETFLEP